eukprot:8216583-Pyramimonas_sp.AAC.1
MQVERGKHRALPGPEVGGPKPSPCRARSADAVAVEGGAAESDARSHEDADAPCRPVAVAHATRRVEVGLPSERLHRLQRRLEPILV